MFFKTHKENLRLRKQVLDLTYKMNKAQGELAIVKSEHEQTRRMVQTLTKDLAAANKKLRRQTEADLLVNALKALKIIPSEEKEQDYFHRETQLQNQLSALGQGRSIDRALGGSPQVWPLGGLG